MPSISGFWNSIAVTEFKKGKIIVSPEDKLDKVYYLVKGNVKQYVITPTGEKIVIHIFKKDSFFPIALVLGKVTNKYFFEAVTNIKVKVEKAEKVVKMLKSNPKALIDLTIRLARGIDGLAYRLSQALSENVQKRLISQLKYLSESYGTPSSKGTKIKIPLTHQELANWLGVSRETVTREMKNLSNKKLVEYTYKHITLLKKNN